MKYNFKVLYEIALGVISAVAIFALTDIANHGDFADWKVWLPTLAAGSARVAAATAVNLIVALRDRIIPPVAAPTSGLVAAGGSRTPDAPTGRSARR